MFTTIYFIGYCAIMEGDLKINAMFRRFVRLFSDKLTAYYGSHRVNIITGFLGGHLKSVSCIKPVFCK